MWRLISLFFFDTTLLLYRALTEIFWALLMMQPIISLEFSGDTLFISFFSIKMFIAKCASSIAMNVPSSSPIGCQIDPEKRSIISNTDDILNKKNSYQRMKQMRRTTYPSAIWSMFKICSFRAKSNRCPTIVAICGFNCKTCVINSPTNVVRLRRITFDKSSTAT